MRTALPFALTLAVIIANLPSRASAQNQAGAEEARKHHERGLALYEEARYEDAIAEFRRAYELKADPTFLFDIAQGYRQLGSEERALFFYRRYLSTYPNAPNRAEVEMVIAEIERDGPSQPVAAPASEPAAPAVVVSASPAHTSTDERPYRRAWVWALAGAVLTVGVASFVVMAINERGNDVPRSQLGNAKLF